MPVVLITLSKFISDIIFFLGGASLLFSKAVRELLKPPYYPQLLIDQIHQIGNRSLGLVLATAVSTGAVMALQFGIGLEKFGGTLYIPKLVGLSIVKELGPVFTSLMLAARVGAGIASEVGSMKVTQQIDAIRALGTSPIKKIVIPRILACLICLPLLTVLANTAGIYGGMLVSAAELNMNSDFYMQKIIVTVTLEDYMVGLMKTVVFSLIIGTSACYFGMTAHNGTRGVGISTTKAVVTSSISIVLSDFLLTKLFWMFFKWTS